jgi:hypothetical protein
MVQHTLWSSLAWPCLLRLTLGWTLGGLARAGAEWPQPGEPYRYGDAGKSLL